MSHHSDDKDDEEEAYEVVPTACVTWSLNKTATAAAASGETQACFWWNSEYSISVWADALGVPADALARTIDEDVWQRYLDVQLANVYKVCVKCRKPDDDDDDDEQSMGVCCYCASIVHTRCARPARDNEVAHRRANAAFASHMRVCAACDDDAPARATSEGCTALTSPPRRRAAMSVAVVRKAVQRVRTLRDELPESVLREVDAVDAAAQALRATRQYDSSDNDDDVEALMRRLRHAMRAYLQTPQSLACFARVPVPAKGGGVGVVARCDVPAFVIVGVYPGYADRMSGEHAKLGRPTPRYALMHLNCADYHNRVFAELRDALTPYINEPGVDETSNCAWLQEPHRAPGRLSVMTVRALRAGEELLIGYGPHYPRTYAYGYDAYACQAVDGHDDPPCLALWHWRSADVASAEFVCYVGYLAAESRYFLWETADDAAVSTPTRAADAQSPALSPAA